MENTEHHYLRINGERFPLPEELHGNQHIVTAVTRGPEHEYIGVGIAGAKFNFGHAAMRALLQRLSEAGSGPETQSLVKQTLQNIQRLID